MVIEELAFKNVTELTELPKEVLLMIIALLQQDRKCWIEQYTRGHNDFIDIKTRIDKAIEYIKEEVYGNEYGNFVVAIGEDNGCPEDALKELLEILKGSDK